MINVRTITGSNSITIRPHPFGPEWGTVISSGDPVYRFLRAAAELFLAGLIDADELIEHDCRWMQGTIDALCPAARKMSGSIFLAVYEPPCVCWPYGEGACDHPWPTDDDRRARLRKLIGD